jgi:hypothetical protein
VRKKNLFKKDGKILQQYLARIILKKYFLPLWLGG